MNKKFNIELPEIKTDSETVVNRNRGMFKMDLDKGGMLAKVFIFAYMNQPISTSKLTEKLQEHYHVEFNRGTVYNSAKKLVDLGLLNTITSGDVLMIPDPEKTEIHNKIVEKFFLFVNQMPKHFRNAYNKVNYYWLSNGEGYNYIEWCCKILRFGVKENGSQRSKK